MTIRAPIAPATDATVKPWRVVDDNALPILIDSLRFKSGVQLLPAKRLSG